VNKADLQPEQRLYFEKVESYYLDKASEQAAFSLNCPAANVSSKVVSTQPSVLRVPNPDGTFPDSKNELRLNQGVRISTIGVEGCAQRMTYAVLCGPYQNYYPQAMHPCDVVPSNNAAARITDRNSHQQ
jgi:hypothetical protein